MDTFVRGNIINFSRFDRRVEHVARHGDLVLIMGEETVVPRVDAPSAGLKAGQTVRRRFTNIWRLEGGEGRIFWRHANVIPSVGGQDAR